MFQLQLVLKRLAQRCIQLMSNLGIQVKRKQLGSINKAGTNCLPIAVTCHSLSGKPEFKRESQGRAEDFNRRKIPIFRYFRDENTEKHWLNCSFWSKIAVLPTFLDHTGLKY